MAKQAGEDSGRMADWTAGRRARFLEHLSKTANVSASARTVGMSESSVRRLRKQDAQFEGDWERALRDGYGELELLLLRRAMVGARPKGEQPEEAGETAGYSDGFAIKLLEAHRKTVGAAPLSVPSDPEAAKRRLEAKLDQMERRRSGAE